MITIPMSVSATNVTIPFVVTATNVNVPMTIGASYQVVDAEGYDGDYEVTPRLYSQLLDTNGKLMHDDVTVYEIPITRTSNVEGGLTVLIG